MTYQFGMIGLGVMGRNLAWNIADHGYSVATWNREQEMTDEVMKLAPGKLFPQASLKELVASLEKPRRIMIMLSLIHI